MMAPSGVRMALKGGSALLLLLLLEPERVVAGSVDGMKCLDGTVLTGDTGPERVIESTMFCKMFPKHPWQYPPLGYGNVDQGVSFPWDCSRIMGGYIYPVSGKPACPARTPEKVHTDCLASSIPKEIIRDMACAIKKDPEKLGNFLNNKNKNRNLIEFAAFMAHVGQETGDLKTIWESDGRAGQYCSYFYPGEDAYCANALFYGRGVHQLTHPSNYSDFSEYWFKDRTVLLKNPEKLILDMELSWGSAIWFWMEPRFHHNGDDSCATWSLQHEALFEGLGFGETTSTINGGIECGGSNDIGPWQRITRLIFFLDVLGIPMPWVNDGVVKLPPFITEGCSSNNEMELLVKHTTWENLEKADGTAECTGWNQPYPCGWGGLTTGPPSIPKPLTAFKKGAPGVTKAPLCPVPWTKAPNQNTWPYNIAPNEGYYTSDGSGSTGGGSTGGGSTGGGSTGGEGTGGGSTGGEGTGGGGTGGGSTGGEGTGGGGTGGGSTGGGGDTGDCSVKFACIDRCIDTIESVFAALSI